MAADQVVVLGIGNILLGDEGVGIHIVRELERNAERLPPGTAIVDGGTLGLELLPIVQAAHALVLVDAVALGRAPGSVATFAGDAIEATLSRHVSPHQVGSADLIGVARLMGVLPRRTALVGDQPEAITFSLELSTAVRAALPAAVEATRRRVMEFSRELADA